MIGPRPIDTVGNSQKSGISHGMRVGRQAAARRELAAEVLELLDRQPAFEKRAGVDAGRGVALEVDESPSPSSSLPRKKWLKPTS